MQLLPLVEMYCKWSLEEDCTSLHALMLRFDSEADLDSHDLGRSLLLLVRDDAFQTDILPQCNPLPAPVNPFRERLSTAALAIRGIRHQVHIFICVLRASSTVYCIYMWIAMPIKFLCASQYTNLRASLA